MKKSGFLFLIVVFLLVGNNAFATHMLGGDFSWKNLGNDSFLIQLTVYRDCNGVNLGYAEIVFECNSSGSSISTITIQKPVAINITPVCKGICTRCESSSCSFQYGIEKYVYYTIVSLASASSCCEVLASYSMCCRSGSITTGAGNKKFYIEAMINRCISPVGSELSFKPDPSLILCKNQDYFLNFGLLDNASLNNGQRIDSVAVVYDTPLQDKNSYISYNGSYSADKPLFFWGFPHDYLAYPRGFRLDHQTGELSFRPDKAEVASLVLKGMKYINGNLIGFVQRDITLIVATCPPNISPTLISNSYLEVTAGDTARFTIPTADPDRGDSLSLTWDSSIAGATWYDTGSLNPYKPVGHFSWVTDTSDANGQPHFFVVTAKDDKCPIPGMVSKSFSVLVKRSLNCNISITHSSCNIYHFSVTPEVPRNYNYAWTISYPTYSKQFTSRSFQLLLSQPGNYPYQLSVSDNIYKYTYSGILQVDSLIGFSVSGVTDICPGDSATLYVRFSDPQMVKGYSWSTGDSGTTQTTTHALMANKNIRLTIKDTNNCTSTSETMIKVHKLVPLLEDVYHFCYGNHVEVQAQSSGILNETISKKWFVSGNTTPFDTNDFVHLSSPGTYVLELNNSLGCNAYDTFQVSQFPRTITDAGNDTVLCSNSGIITLPKMFSTTIHSYAWYGKGIKPAFPWYVFNPGDSSFVNGEKASIKLLVIDSNNCQARDTAIYTIMKGHNPPDAGDSFKHFCQNDAPVKLIGLPSNGIWAGTGVTQNDYFDPSLAGIGMHTLSYSLTDTFCPAFTRVYYKVTEIPRVIASTATGKTEFCSQYGWIQLYGSPVGGKYGGTWYGDLDESHQFDSKHASGNYPVIYEFRDDDGCANSDTVVITIGDPEVNISPKDTTSCKNTFPVITANYSIAPGIIWNTISGSDGSIINQYNKNIIYVYGPKDLKRGFYTLRVRTNDAICINTIDTIRASIAPAPKAGFRLSTPKVKPPDLTVNFYDTSKIEKGKIESYFWIIDTTEYFVKDPVHVFTANPGKYDVFHSVTTDAGCSGSTLESKLVEVLSSLPNDIQSLPVLNIYPNPAGDILYVDLESNNANLAFLQLFDQAGKEVRNLKIAGQNKAGMLLSDLSKGTYILKITLDDESVFYKMMMKD